MFESLTEKLSGIFDQLTRRGALTEADVGTAMREVRRALLEADVALDVVRSFTDKVREPGRRRQRRQVGDARPDGGQDRQRRSGRDAGRGRRPDQPRRGAAGRHHDGRPAGRRQDHHDRQDRQAPHRAHEQARPDGLARRQAPGRAGTVGRARAARSASTRCRSSPARRPVQIARRAEQAARLQGYDVVMLDTAGRTHIDEPLMAEMAEIKAAANPHEILLVADSLTGQDAVNLAKSFDERVGITGIVLTRVDGDGRGGAALSMRAVTGKPIKLLGTGEKMDALEDFHPARIANRILGMGDIVSLVEKAAENDRCRKGHAHRREDAQGQVRPRGSERSAGPGRKARRHGRHHGHAARHGQDQGADGRRQHRRADHQAPARHHLVDDARASGAIPTSSRPRARSASRPAPAPRSRTSTGC